MDFTLIREKTICFTGHRPDKLNGYNPKDNSSLLRKLSEVISQHILDGVDTFISGMALGIDMWAARIVLSLKKLFPHIKLICAIPCSEQWSRWFQTSIDEWHYIVGKADNVVYVSNEPYNSWCMQKRNEWMVNHSHSVISVWDGSTGGTKNCIKYAKKCDVPILNINPTTLELTQIA